LITAALYELVTGLRAGLKDLESQMNRFNKKKTKAKKKND